MNKENQIIEEYFVEGMHCKACEVLLERKIATNSSITQVKADLSRNSITLKGNYNSNSIADELTELVKDSGYKILKYKTNHEIKWLEFIYALPVSLFLITIFILLQKLGIIDFSTNSNTLGFGSIFVIGVIASLSSCMAVVGGLLLSLSATFEKETKTHKNISQIVFHISRIISFFIFGGILGLIGSLIKISPNIYALFEIFVIFVMFCLALNMLDIFPYLQRFQLSTPKFITHEIIKLSNNHSLKILGPLVLGALTFFLPCGFTQSMQLYALSTGSFISGASVMLVFSLGTLPALALISYISISLARSKFSGIFYKTSGIIILFFVLINLLGVLSIFGVIPPIVNLG